MTRATIAIGTTAKTPAHQQQWHHHNKGNYAVLQQAMRATMLACNHNYGKDACINKHGYHGTNSAAILPGCMQNRFLCVCHSGVGRMLIWNWLRGDQLISTESIPPRLFSEVLSPQIAPISCLHLPKLSTLVDCCLGWVAQHLQVFCMLLATHCHHIVVVPLSSSYCHCQIAVLELLPSFSSTS